MGQGVGDYIIRTREVENVTGEFGDVGEMARWNRKEYGFMIGEQGKNSGFKEKIGMADGGVSCKEFTIKVGVFGLGRG